MDHTVFLEIFGYIGTALVILSMMMSSLRLLRIFNMSGALISAIYAICMQAWPVVLLNVTLFIVNGVKLITDRHRAGKGDKT